MSGTWYVESSVILSRVYRQPDHIDVEALIPACTSILTRVECLRSFDRNRLFGRLSDAHLLECRESLLRMIRGFRTVGMEPAILERASAPVSVPLKTLDAIHLCTALQWRDDQGEEVRFATHDRGLAAAARAYGLQVVGA